MHRISLPYRCRVVCTKHWIQRDIIKGIYRSNCVGNRSYNRLERGEMKDGRNVSQETQEAQVKPEEEETSALKQKAEVKARTAMEKDKTTSIIDDARKAAKEIRAANEETRQLQQQQELLMAQQQLGGRSEAGQAPIPIKQISEIEYAEKVLTGEVNPLEDK